MTVTRLVTPSRARLPALRAALERGWSPDSTRGADAIAEMLARIDADPDAFVQRAADNREGGGPPVPLPDGSTVPRLPSLTRWIWAGADAEDGDGDRGFAGSIGLRWNHGFAPLPPHCLGHVGYNVAPWMRGRGHATRALAALLPLAREVGLPAVELSTDLDNRASQRVIEANGGVLVERFDKPAAFGGGPGLRFRIDLA